MTINVKPTVLLSEKQISNALAMAIAISGELHVVGAGIDQAYAAGGAAHRRKHRVQVDRVLAARQGHRLGCEAEVWPARGQGR